MEPNRKLNLKLLSKKHIKVNKVEESEIERKNKKKEESPHKLGIRYY